MRKNHGSKKIKIRDLFLPHRHHRRLPLMYDEGVSHALPCIAGLALDYHRGGTTAAGTPVAAQGLAAIPKDLLPTSRNRWTEAAGIQALSDEVPGPLGSWGPMDPVAETLLIPVVPQRRVDGQDGEGGRREKGRLQRRAKKRKKISLVGLCVISLLPPFIALSKN